MLWELWQYLTTRCPPAVRQLGYLEEIIGIRARHQRMQTHWEPHLRLTRETILESAARLTNRNKIVLLGTGWLHDVPCKELLEQFQEVHLIDILHPSPVQRLAQREPRLHLHTLDVTGLSETLFSLKKQLRQTRRRLPLPFVPLPPFANYSADLVVSVNLLSQLPLRFWDTLEPLQNTAHEPLYSSAELAAFSQLVFERHLEGLERCAPHRCLITDTRETWWNRRNQLMETHDLLSGLILPPAQKEWIWTLADFGEMKKNRRVLHSVIAIHLGPAESFHSLSCS